MLHKVVVTLQRNSSPKILAFLILAGLTTHAQDRLARFTASTELVQVPVIALDQEGRVATELSQEDFEVFEDGVKQDIIGCMRETAPVSAGLVLDKSRSMKSNLPLVIQGAFNLLDTHLKSDDEFLLIAFDGMPRLISPQFIHDSETLKHLLASNVVEAKGLTSLYDALYLGVSSVRQKAKNEHRAVILITDGGDTNSRYQKREILDYLEEAEVPVFAVNASEPNIFQTVTRGRNGKPEFVTEDDVIGPAERGGPKVLKELTSATGGAVFTAHAPEDLPRIMGVVYDLISNQYTISYKPHANRGASGTNGRHKIEVKLGASDNRFAGYHLDYKHQYFRSNEPAAKTTTVAAVPSPER